MRPPAPRPGGPVLAGQVNAIAEDLRRAAARDWVPPAQRPRTVRLSGTASPYNFGEVYGTAGGNWAALTGGLSGTAREQNGVGSLNGKVARVAWDAAAGEWRFLWRRLHSSAPPPCQVTYNVRGCSSSVVPGASVTLGSYGTKTTDGGGNATFTGIVTGSYTLTVSAPGYTTYTTTVTITCGGTFSASVLLAPASGYTCWSCGGCNVSTPPTFYIDTPAGTVTMNLVSSGVWRGCIMMTATVYTGTVGGTAYGTRVQNCAGAAAAAGLATVPVPVQFTFGAGLGVPCFQAAYAGGSSGGISPQSTLISGLDCTFDFGGSASSTGCAAFTGGVRMPWPAGSNTVVCSPWSITNTFTVPNNSNNYDFGFNGSSCFFTPGSTVNLVAHL